MLRILASVRTFYPIIGGAELSMYTLLNRLSKENEVHVIFNGFSNNDITKDGLHIHERAIGVRVPQLGQVRTYLESYKWRSILDDYISENEPDIILTQLQFALPSVEIARKHRIPSVLFIRDYLHFCPTGFANGIDCNRACWRCLPDMNSKLYNILKFGQDILQYPFTRRLLKWSERTLNDADSVITNSQFLSNLTKQWFGVETDHIYPFINFESVLSDDSNREYITMIRPDLLKGIKIFLNIAKKMPNQKFLCVGKIPKYFEFKSELYNLKNVTCMGWTDDMKDVYSKTKMLVVPSIWPEPFGRVCVEAMVNGIPPIVSNRGGLPEVVSDAGIVIDDPFCIDDWVDNIKQINSDTSYYDELSQKAQKRAEVFTFDREYKKLCRIIDDLMQGNQRKKRNL